MASLLCPASSCRSASFSRRASSPAPPFFPCRGRHGGAPSVPLASPAASPPPWALAAASYGYGGGDLLRPIDTQTIIIAAAVVSAVSLSLVLGLKVAAASFSLSRLWMTGCWSRVVMLFAASLQGDPVPCDRCAGNGILQLLSNYVFLSLARWMGDGLVISLLIPITHYCMYFFKHNAFLYDCSKLPKPTANSTYLFANGLVTHLVIWSVVFPDAC
jgi:hypothetical protein